MNTFLAASALVAALFAPGVASAAQPPGAVVALSVSQRFDVVDSRSGAVVAILVPVSGTSGLLRIIGNARSQAVDVKQASVEKEALTPLQFAEQQQRELDAEFHIDHNP